MAHDIVGPQVVAPDIGEHATDFVERRMRLAEQAFGGVRVGQNGAERLADFVRDRACDLADQRQAPGMSIGALQVPGRTSRRAVTHCPKGKHDALRHHQQHQ
nr:hypothetical protein [uncultured Steroidobacter sp.]